MHNYPSFETVKEMRKHFKEILIQNWLGETFLHWQWWLLIILLLVPWFIWWKVVDKKRLNVIVPFGLLILIFNSFIDDLGTGSFWWYYPHKIIPTLNILKSPDYSIIPCAMMLVFQYFNTWRTFLLSNLVLSLFFSQVGERIFIALGLYELITWNLFFSILHYNIAGLLARWMVLKISKIAS